MEPMFFAANHISNHSGIIPFRYGKFSEKIQEEMNGYDGMEYVNP